MTHAPVHQAKETRSTCPYCGVGCGVIIESVGAQITHVRGDPDHPANQGRLCTKGSTLHLTTQPHIAQQVRLLQPMVRAQRGVAPTPTTWDIALDTVGQKLAHIVQQHGPDAVGVYVSGQLLTEDYYVFNKLTKGLLGTNNIDTNSRLCMSSAVAGYKLTLGADAPPACYEDVDHTACLFIAGSNTAWAHPVLFRRIEAAKAARPNLKVIVADPRRTDTCSLADLHLPLQPGTDVMLFNGLLHIMLQAGWTDNDFIAQHTQGFDALAQTLRDYTPAAVSQVCGLPETDLWTAARWIAGVPDSIHPGQPWERQPTLSLYCQGLNQSSSGTAKNTSLIHLHLATGQIGKPGAGPFSLTGQPNAMGGREVGGLANLLSAHRDLANPTHRAEVAALWGVPTVPEKPGKTAVEMFQAAADGEIKALWIACTNPAQSLPDQATVRRALERAELVVVQEAYATAATCDWADVLLPASTWGEKEGTVTNSERRISRVRAAVPSPQATQSNSAHNGPRHDWDIVVEIGRRLEKQLPSRSNRTLFPYQCPEDIWNEHRESTRGRDLDITGLSYDLLEASPRQWPCPEGRTEGQERLYTDGRFATADGKARFVATQYLPTAEQRTAAHPYSLTTGRLRDQWHGMTRTSSVGTLLGHTAQPELHIHPGDLADLQAEAGDLLRLTSARGSVVLPALPNPDMGRKQLFVPMHWGGEFLGGHNRDGSPKAGINALTPPIFCPTSKQPEFKHTAVRLEKAALPWRLQAMAHLPPGQALKIQQALRPWMVHFQHAVCVPFGENGVWFQAAHPQAPEGTWLQALCDLLGLASDQTLRYDDGPRHVYRRIRATTNSPTGERHLQAFLLAGTVQSFHWMSALVQGQVPLTAPAWTLLQDLTEPTGQAAIAKVKPLCNCLGVSEQTVINALGGCSGTPSMRLSQLQTQLKCGTQCGSCVPEIKRLIEQHPTVAA